MNDCINTLVKELPRNPTDEQIKRLKQAVENSEKPLREKMLADSSKKPLRRFLQIDGWANLPVDEELPHPDENGYGLTSQWVNELRHFDIPVRIQILKGATITDAIALLKKTLNWLKKDKHLLSEEFFQYRIPDGDKK